MVAKASSGQVAALSVQGKGSRNKRKFRADPPISEVGKVLHLPHNDSPAYELSAEKFDINQCHGEGSTCDMCGKSQGPSDALKLDLGLPNSNGPAEVGSSWPIEEVEEAELHDADWSDITETQLEELVLNNLDAIFKSAIRKIVDCGYPEELATKAVLRSGLCYGSKDTVSNIVDNTLAYLKSGQEIQTSTEHCFKDLLQLEKYILAELVCVLREVRPFSSTGDAMWCLLICDMNLSNACAMNGDSTNSFLNVGTSLAIPCISTQPRDKVEGKSSEMRLSTPCLPAPTVSASVGSKVGENVEGEGLNFASLNLNGKTSDKEGLSSPTISLDRPFNATATQITNTEEKFVSSRKAYSNSSKRESILRQKSFHLDKNNRTYGSKGASRATKLSSFGGLMLDRKLRDSAGINLKNASLRMKSKGIDVSHGRSTLGLSTSSTTSSSLSSSLSSLRASSSFTLDNLRTLPASSTLDTVPKSLASAPQSLLSVADTELSLSLPTKCDSATVTFSSNLEDTKSSYTWTPDERSLTHWAPLDKRDEMIVKLVPRIKELENHLQEWTEWANQKVMQAARRLSKDKTELKTLRQEKEEVERLKKDKQTLEENTMKKLSEMENALSKASGQVERANSAVRRLEKENLTLRQEMEAAKIRAIESATSCQEMSMREKKTLTKFQFWEKQKSVFQEELATEKRKLSQLQQELGQANDLYLQLEARWKQEEKAKEDLLAQANSIWKERTQLDASATSKEEAIKLKAETNLQRYKDDIHRLEKETSQLRLKTDSSKIAALKRGIDGSYATQVVDSRTSHTSKELQASNIKNNFQEYSGAGGVKRERECVMCLTEEMSVVFLPCAHQVVCSMCNEMHEKQGMKDCPSCRSPIQRRIFVRFARP